MKTYIVTQDSFHAALIDRLLRAVALPEYYVVRGGQGTAAIEMGTSLLAARGAPVVVVMDADTMEPHVIQEQGEMYRYLLPRGGYAPGTPWDVLMAVPQVEAVLFGDHEALACLLGRPLTEREKIEGEFRPRAVLDRLLADVGMDRDALLERMDARFAARFAAHPLVQSLAQFVRAADAALALADAAA